MHIPRRGCKHPDRDLSAGQMLPERDIHGVETLWQPVGPIRVVTHGVWMPPNRLPRPPAGRSPAGCSGRPTIPGEFYDELVAPGGGPRPAAVALWKHFTDLGPEALAERQQAADREMRAIGVTFTVYEGTGGMTDRPWPFDIIPRVMPVRPVAPDRGGSGPETQRPQSLHRRRLPRPARRQLRGGPFRAGHRLPELQAGVRGRRPSRRRLGPHLRQ